VGRASPEDRGEPSVVESPFTLTREGGSLDKQAFRVSRA